jgi:hypothetical protein
VWTSLACVVSQDNGRPDRKPVLLLALPCRWTAGRSSIMPPLATNSAVAACISRWVGAFRDVLCCVVGKVAGMMLFGSLQEVLATLCNLHAFLHR